MTNECLQVQVSALVTFDLDSYLKLLFAFSVHGILIYLELFTRQSYSFDCTWRIDSTTNVYQGVCQGQCEAMRI